MAASTITYTDKVQVIDPDRDATELWRSVDANEVKTVVNSHATLLDTNTSAIATKLTASNNLSDLTNAATARTNLSLGSLAVKNSVNNSDWSGADLAVTNGGTGASDAATARTNLGVVGQTGDESLRAYRPVGATITASNALTDACATANTFYPVDTSSAAVIITVGDGDVGTVGFEYEFFVTDATNGISFAVSGSQSIVSEDAYLTRATVGGLMLKYIATNTWVLLGATS